MREFRILAICLGLLICFSGMVMADEDTIHVPFDQPTIQAGIIAASDDDTVLVADGIYTGEGNRDIDFLGKLITVQSEHGAESCIIDCEGSEDIHYFYGGAPDMGAYKCY